MAVTLLGLGATGARPGDYAMIGADANPVVD